LYDGDPIIQCICMNSTVDGLKNLVCDRWEIYNALSIELSYTKEYKYHVVENQIKIAISCCLLLGQEARNS